MLEGKHDNLTDGNPWKQEAHAHPYSEVTLQNNDGMVQGEGEGEGGLHTLLVPTSIVPGNPIVKPRLLVRNILKGSPNCTAYLQHAAEGGRREPGPFPISSTGTPTRDRKYLHGSMVGDVREGDATTVSSPKVHPCTSAVERKGWMGRGQNGPLPGVIPVMTNYFRPQGRRTDRQTHTHRQRDIHTDRHTD